MKFPFLASIALASCLAMPAFCRAEEPEKGNGYATWEKYSPKESGFQLHFPKKPIVREAAAATGQFHLAGIPQAKDGELGLTVNWMLRQEPFDGKEVALVYLKGQELGMVGAAKGKVVERMEVKIEGVTGREFILTIDEQRSHRVRSLVSGRLICTLSVLGNNAESVKSKEATMFLDSFKLVK